MTKMKSWGKAGTVENYGQDFSEIGRQVASYVNKGSREKLRS